MAIKPGVTAPETGIYWCSVCKLPGHFTAGQVLPECRNKCGRGGWEFIRSQAAPEAPSGG